MAGRRGERGERRRGRIKRPERVAAVGERRCRTVGKESTGHRNRAPAPTCLIDKFRLIALIALRAMVFCKHRGKRIPTVAALPRNDKVFGSGSVCRLPLSLRGLLASRGNPFPRHSKNANARRAFRFHHEQLDKFRFIEVFAFYANTL